MAASNDVTLAFLGCGNLGIAILSGVLASITEARDNASYAASGEVPQLIPTKFIACVRKSAQRIQDAVSKYPSIPVQIFQNDNISGVTEADAIILGCKPWMLKEILDVPGMRKALKGKLLISILAGCPVDQIEAVLYPDDSIPTEDRCRVVRAMPNTAAMIRESMTTIETSSPPLPDKWDKLLTWIFTRVGQVSRLPPDNMDACTSLAGSGPGFVALVLEGLADGGVAMGLPRAEAQLMAAQVMRGTSAMVLDGEHPSLLREQICTPGGCTVGGLMVLEENAVRGSIARSIREATVIASQLGQGVKNVNGTRH
ncbi:pyrroline-5-carboxylate reductase family protein [Aspergillus ruber CBS 135680]|uniref:Pyrroline-5-carboxylate reductase n=1 Tax=Aspergillus ruber (strain CBS 135680) TaxID=1388766 RepID=A0A017SM34_ASPRC|nr:pyrroline-5-carboxylate reductase [Aspergillus ruber CBS 135680]EYE97689.1 pyrroline-5-carboxylate reductase [Aspergillus ruber CBS 135680]